MLGRLLGILFNTFFVDVQPNPTSRSLPFLSSLFWSLTESFFSLLLQGVVPTRYVDHNCGMMSLRRDKGDVYKRIQKNAEERSELKTLLVKE